MSAHTPKAKPNQRAPSKTNALSNSDGKSGQAQGNAHNGSAGASGVRVFEHAVIGLGAMGSAALYHLSKVSKHVLGLVRALAWIALLGPVGMRECDSQCVLLFFCLCRALLIAHSIVTPELHASFRRSKVSLATARALATARLVSSGTHCRIAVGAG